MSTRLRLIAGHSKPRTEFGDEYSHKPKQREANNLGFMRLALALLVILSHCSELIDGNRSREPLTRFAGTLSFGELAVYGFFLISGFLILQSRLRSRSYLQ